jgi:hypothetical protein
MVIVASASSRSTLRSTSVEEEPVKFWVENHSKMVNFRYVFGDANPEGDDGRSLFFTRGKDCDLAEFWSKK